MWPPWRHLTPGHIEPLWYGGRGLTRLLPMVLSAHIADASLILFPIFTLIPSEFIVLFVVFITS